MKGVVLCGGRSTRMGSDKGLLTEGGVTWAEIAVAKLSALQMEVVISVNKEQVENYSTLFRTDQLIVDDETARLKGPLLGLLSVHRAVPEEDLFLLACDMVNISVEILARLIDASTSRSYDAYVYKTTESLQPLCGLYFSKGLERVYQLYEQGKLQKMSMMYVLECLGVNYIEAETSIEPLFANYNSPGEIDQQ